MKRALVVLALAALARNGFTKSYRIVIERGEGIVEQAVYGNASNTGRSDSFCRSVAVFADTSLPERPAKTAVQRSERKPI
jgi:hypothetical protein